MAAVVAVWTSPIEPDGSAISKSLATALMLVVGMGFNAIVFRF